MHPTAHCDIKQFLISMTVSRGLCAVLREGAIRIMQGYAGTAGVSKTVRTDGNTRKGWELVLSF
jgi:hypothetical protein